MTEFERQLREIGVLPKQEKKEEPKPVVRNYTFDDPRDENGEVPF